MTTISRAAAALLSNSAWRALRIPAATIPAASVWPRAAVSSHAASRARLASADCLDVDRADYAALVPDAALRKAVFGRIRDGWLETRDQLLTLTGQANLLDHQPALQHAVKMRLPYINPLNALQIDLIRRRRTGSQDPRIAEGIHLTINGIAAGLRNSG